MIKSKITSISDKTVDLADYLFTKIISLTSDVERSRSNNALMAASIILLSLASGYTTYHGFLNYLDYSLIALMITFGIQCLLIITSWQFGSYPTKKDIPIGLYIVFLITFSTSVFFSFTDYFSNIFTNEVKQEESIINVENSFDKLINNINTIVQSTIQKETLKLKENLVIYENNAFIEASKTKVLLEKQLLKHEALANSSNELRKLEEEKGGSIVNGVKSLKGYGAIAKSHEQTRLWHKTNFVDPIHKSIQQFNMSWELFRDEISTISKYLNNSLDFNMDIVLDLKEKCNVFVNFSSTQEKDELKKSLCALDSAILESIEVIKEYRSFKSTSAFKSIERKGPPAEKITNMAKVIRSLPSSQDNYSLLLDEISRLRSAELGDIHIFRLSLIKLSEFNSLAIVSIIVATFVDLLILFCGLLGAKQKSFLDAYNSSDLRHMKERAIENIMSIDRVEDGGDSLLVKNIKKLLRLAVYDPTQIEYGYIAVVQEDIIKENKIEEWIGVYISLGLAAKLEDKTKIGLHIRLYLWMAEVINKDSDSGELLVPVKRLLDELRFKKTDPNDEEILKLKNLQKQLNEILNNEGEINDE